VGYSNACQTPVKALSALLNIQLIIFTFFSQKKSIIENVLNSSFYNEGFSSKHLGECKNIWLFGLCYAMDGGYKG